MDRETLSDLKEELVQMIWEIGAYKIGYRPDSFQYTTGKRGPDYFSLREKDVFGDPQPVIDKAAQCINELLKENFCQIEAVLGVPSSGEPLAKAIAEDDSLKCFKFDRKIEDRPSIYWTIDPRLEPELDPSITVNGAIIENAISTGISVDRYARLASNRGFNPYLVVTLVDRQMGGINNLRNVGYLCRSILKVDDLISRAPSYIDSHQKNLVYDNQLKECVHEVKFTRTFAQQLRILR